MVGVPITMIDRLASMHAQYTVRAWHCLYTENSKDTCAHTMLVCDIRVLRVASPFLHITVLSCMEGWDS